MPSAHLDLSALRHTGEHLLPMGDGHMQVVVNAAAHGAPRGIALIAHPHPLLGGSAKHKVPHALATALAEAGWWVLRPNFRGVGLSSGQHDHGRGELEDLDALCLALHATQPQAPLALLGFSFGAFVMSHLGQRLQARQTPATRTVLMGTPFGRVPAGRDYDSAPPLPQSLVIHAECDEAAPLSAALAWARPCAHPVTVIPGADHFFTGHLNRLRALVLQHLNTCPSPCP